MTKTEWHEPMPWISGGDACDFGYDVKTNEPEPNVRPLDEWPNIHTFCENYAAFHDSGHKPRWPHQLGALLTGVAMLMMSPVVIIALVFDVFRGDGALWRDVKTTIRELRAVWRGKKSGVWG